MKRSNLILTILIVAIIIAGAVYYLNQGEEEQAVKDTFKVGMVTDVGGLGDQSFNDAAYRGLKRAEEELGIEIEVVESNAMTDYVPNLSSLAEQDYDMVWAIGFLMMDALNQVAEMYPDTTFGLVDAVVDKPNVASVTFKEEEGSFLVGLIAGKMTETGKVGYVGGMEMPLIQKFQAGYEAGVKAANPDAEIMIGYTGAFDDPAAGKELALTQFGQGADIIYHASGACGIGVIEAAEEKGLYAIGVDSPQAHLAPENVLTSMVKRVDVAVYNEVKSLYEGNFEPGHKIYGLAENGVGPSEHANEMVPEDVMELVEEYKEKIINGEYTVPTKPEDVE
ncbi:BMP family lipoprotein [Halothermothrix orenii]|uniref:Basic membrane lipoprotein n=1 Tax=Halothermothrix orenii (strain H 168 / OCM 544 / DSM 9562) TaxID=373903 RepID=B8D074_HALOH|nr:BMP family ABC transporter substrate-binding protein [Halothermothrix orenii]ACL68828.1 basic membrane lipoprotein [Halothermothrix orenii H 168]